jgi:hypothetical protein
LSLLFNDSRSQSWEFSYQPCARCLGVTVTLAGLVSFNCSVNHGLSYFALVLRTICQPASAAIAYSLDKKLSGKRNILGFDLVEFFFSRSRLLRTPTLVEKTFDSRLINHFIQEFKRSSSSLTAQECRVLVPFVSALHVSVLSVHPPPLITLLFRSNLFQVTRTSTSTTSTSTCARFEEQVKEFLFFRCLLPHAPSPLSDGKALKQTRPRQMVDYSECMGCWVLVCPMPELAYPELPLTRLFLACSFANYNHDTRHISAQVP